MCMCRQHVSVVMDVLRATIVLTTRRAVTEADDSLGARLMDLRNHILAGGSAFRFVTLRELEIMPGYSSYGLLGEHGKYESCIMVSKEIMLMNDLCPGRWMYFSEAHVCIAI
jgi:hypothetical protein